jgi:formylglycine-generating enzyme required for sulfatase activity
VTFADWDACVSIGPCPQLNDSSFGRRLKPLINVSWEDAQQYVGWLSTMTGKTYRLLTEAEWEYAARAGSTTAYPWGDDIGVRNANCAQCGSKWDNQQTSPVGSFKPNAFGLYDMVGNVWQWVQDCLHLDYTSAPSDGSLWTGGDCNYRLGRGGAWDRPPEFLRSATRAWNNPTARANIIGFRLARTLKQ